MPSKTSKSPAVPAGTTFDQLMARGRRERLLTFCTNEEKTAELERAREAANLAFLDGEERKAAQRTVEEARAAVLADPSTVQIHLRGLPNGEFQALVELHPPTEAQVTAAEKSNGQRPLFNEDTFIPELVAKCAIDPQLTPEQARQLLDAWGEGDGNALAAAALQLSRNSSVVDVGI